MSEPREWWIVDGVGVAPLYDDEDEAIRAAGYSAELEPTFTFHVIEKSAYDELGTELDRVSWQRDEFERLAKSWMADHDKLKVKYEPLVAELAVADKDAHKIFDPTNLAQQIRNLDGVAAVNLSEPSPGDLERVTQAYEQTREELASLKKLYGELLEVYNENREARELEVELAEIKPNSLPSFCVAVPSDEWYDTTKALATAEAEVKRLNRECISVSLHDQRIAAGEQERDRYRQVLEEINKNVDDDGMGGWLTDLVSAALGPR